MTIVHVVEPFAAGVSVFVKYLTETMPDDQHIIVHGERKQVMSAAKVEKTFSSPRVRFIKWHSAQRSIHPIKDFRALTELYKILKRLKNKDSINGVHLHSSKGGLLGRIACRILGIRNVFYTPNGAPFLSGKNAFSKYFYRQMEKLGNRFGGKVICSSSQLNAYLRLVNKATYITNGITIDEKIRSTPDQREKFKIVTTGRIIQQKNPYLFNTCLLYTSDA